MTRQAQAQSTEEAQSTEPVVLHRFAAESYEALLPDIPSLCGAFTVADMDFDPRFEPDAVVYCDECETLAKDWTGFYQPEGDR